MISPLFAVQPEMQEGQSASTVPTFARNQWRNRDLLLLKNKAQVCSSPACGEISEKDIYILSGQFASPSRLGTASSSISYSTDWQEEGRSCHFIATYSILLKQKEFRY